jgi:CMP-N-acetylneuraminic acid synthetase
LAGLPFVGYNMPDLIAMIPARMGSKRVPKKNIRFLHGKPLIQYAIDKAKAAGCFDQIWVNSESDLMGELAGQFGVNFHRRPPELATDTATNQDFTAEFLRNHECEYVVMVNPTSPLLRPKTVCEFCRCLRDGGFDTLLSVLEERAECFFGDEPVNFSLHEKINSQDLVPVQKVIWALTAWRRKHFLAVADRGECSVFAGNVGRFPIPWRESCDIDTQEEWDMAEGMLLAEQKDIAGYNGKSAIPTYWGEHHENE